MDDNTFQFTFVGAFGLKDRLRPNVKSVVNAAQNVSQDPDAPKRPKYVNVRMISGDHFETAKAVAIKAGILNDEDLTK